MKEEEKKEEGEGEEGNRLFESKSKRHGKQCSVFDIDMEVDFEDQNLTAKQTHEDFSAEGISEDEEDLLLKNYKFASSLNVFECSLCSQVFSTVMDQRAHFQGEAHHKRLIARSKEVPDEHETSGEALPASNSLSFQESMVQIKLKKAPKALNKTLDELEKSGKAWYGYAAVFLARPSHRLHPAPQYDPSTGSSLDLDVSCVSSTSETIWILLLYSAGHFAGTVFNLEKLQSGTHHDGSWKKSILASKSYHRYVVRKKQGGSQSIRDSESGSRKPKSAGASLRRYNESQLRKDVQCLMKHWDQETYFQRAKRVFYATANINRQVLFYPEGVMSRIRKHELRSQNVSRSSLKPAVVEKIRKVPFPVKRPTKAETLRVFKKLTTLVCHEK